MFAEATVKALEEEKAAMHNSGLVNLILVLLLLWLVLRTDAAQRRLHRLWAEVSGSGSASQDREEQQQPPRRQANTSS